MTTRKEFRKGYSRKLERHIIVSNFTSTLANNIDEVIKELKKIKGDHKEYSEITIEIDDYEGYNGTIVDVKLIGFRLETYEELDIRIQKDINQRAIWNKRDLANYEALKKKLGK